MTEEDKKFLETAVECSIKNIELGGGPFGATIVKDGKIIATTGNSVVPSKDPTAHAEVNCIRKACQVLNTNDLKGCVLYTSCEPCPMCLAASYWARLDKIFYGNDRKDAKNINFDDDFIYEEIKKDFKDRSLPIKKIEGTNAIKAFDIWKEKIDKVQY